MRLEWDTEDDASRPARRQSEDEDQYVDATVEQVDSRTPWDDIGYFGSVSILLVGGVGLLASLGSVSLSILWGAFGLVPWILVAGIACVAMIVVGGVGMGNWDYYSRPPPE